MSWINKPIELRRKDVSEIDNLIENESPDRFWYSSDQDGDNTQEMRILLPVGDSIYYDVRIQTAQFKALKMMHEDFGHTQHVNPVASYILDGLGVVSEEVFEVSQDHDSGILYQAVIDVPGLTHIVIDSLLDDFLHRDASPPQPKKINPENMVKRIIEAQDEGLLDEHYSFHRL